MGLRSEVQRAATAFQQKTDIAVSPHAQVVMSDIIEAITADPHPRWRVGMEKLQDIEQEIIARLPELLHEMQEQEAVEHVITSFDVLHWLTRTLDALCPIGK